MKPGTGTYLKVYDTSEGMICCSAEDEPRVDAAVSAYVDSGGRDRIIEVTLLEGVTFKLLASTVTAWFVSTPATRKARVEINANAEAELEGFEKELGLGGEPWEDSWGDS